MSKQLADRARMRGNERLAERMADHAALAERRATTIRDALLQDRQKGVDASTDLQAARRKSATPRRRTGSDD